MTSQQTGDWIIRQGSKIIVTSSSFRRLMDRKERMSTYFKGLEILSRETKHSIYLIDGTQIDFLPDQSRYLHGLHGTPIIDESAFDREFLGKGGYL